MALRGGVRTPVAHGSSPRWRASATSSRVNQRASASSCGAPAYHRDPAGAMRWRKGRYDTSVRGRTSGSSLISVVSASPTQPIISCDGNGHGCDEWYRTVPTRMPVSSNTSRRSASCKDHVGKERPSKTPVRPAAALASCRRCSPYFDGFPGLHEAGKTRKEVFRELLAPAQ